MSRIQILLPGPSPTAEPGTAPVGSDAVCLESRFHVEQIKHQRVVVAPDRIKHQWEIYEASVPC